MIPKAPTGATLSRFFEAHPNARTALQHYLAECRLRPGEAVLLPSYIGWSPREGSGVFDPIRELQLNSRFYRLDGSLGIDLESLRREIERGEAKVLLLIHYFGHVDPGYQEAVALARRHGLRVVEDAAHAMLSDLIGGICGRLGDVSLYSLHKLLPVESGGLLVRNGAPAGEGEAARIWHHDLAHIGRVRRRNAGFLLQRMAGLADDVEPLWPVLEEGEIPQTVPVRLRRANRDAIYHDLNGAGFGVVSLYHTMIDAIPETSFPESVQLSRTILNLPIHQSAGLGDIEAMISHLKGALLRHRL
jgi:dTDP-4-amino-4,6-dideoxygalactose transaminase